MIMISMMIELITYPRCQSLSSLSSSSSSTSSSSIQSLSFILIRTPSFFLSDKGQRNHQSSFSPSSVPIDQSFHPIHLGLFHYGPVVSMPADHRIPMALSLPSKLRERKERNERMGEWEKKRKE